MIHGTPGFVILVFTGRTTMDVLVVCDGFQNVTEVEGTHTRTLAHSLYDGVTFPFFHSYRIL